MWPILLFVVSFGIGIVAVCAGVGGGVLFVPIVSGFFPFHLDFVRCAGLCVALSLSLAAGPDLLKRGLADLRLAMPAALVASTTSIAGAMLGLAMPVNILQVALGVVILAIVAVMVSARNCEFPEVRSPDALCSILGIGCVYHEQSEKRDIRWQVHRTPQGLLAFVFIGLLAGMFGLGAGWANVPVLNLIMGAPLKVSVATSVFLLAITDTSATWVYINQGALFPMVVIPSVIGVMLGSLIGAKLLCKARPRAIRHLLIGLLIFAGLRAIGKGLGY